MPIENVLHSWAIDQFIARSEKPRTPWKVSNLKKFDPTPEIAAFRLAGAGRAKDAKKNKFTAYTEMRNAKGELIM